MGTEWLLSGSWKLLPLFKVFIFWEILNFFSFEDKVSQKGFRIFFRCRWISQLASNLKSHRCSKSDRDFHPRTTGNPGRPLICEILWFKLSGIETFLSSLRRFIWIDVTFFKMGQTPASFIVYICLFCTNYVGSWFQPRIAGVEGEDVDH